MSFAVFDGDIPCLSRWESVHSAVHGHLGARDEGRAVWRQEGDSASHLLHLPHTTQGVRSLGHL